MLYGAALRLLAFSSHESDVDQARRSVILSRRASARATEMISASGASRSREPVRIPVHDPTGTPGRVAYAVRWRDQVVALALTTRAALAAARCRPEMASKRPSPRCCGWHPRERWERCSATTRW